jgi:hypothetical protein
MNETCLQIQMGSFPLKLWRRVDYKMQDMKGVSFPGSGDELGFSDDGRQKGVARAKSQN